MYAQGIAVVCAEEVKEREKIDDNLWINGSYMYDGFLL